MPAGEKDAKDSQSDGCVVPPERLRGRGEIDTLFRRGKRLRGRNVTIIFNHRPAGAGSLAVIVPRRLGGAVRRNRVRRAIRENLRQNPHPAIYGKNLIVLYNKPAGNEFLADAIDELRALLDRLEGESG